MYSRKRGPCRIWIPDYDCYVLRTSKLRSEYNEFRGGGIEQRYLSLTDLAQSFRRAILIGPDRPGRDMRQTLPGGLADHIRHCIRYRRQQRSWQKSCDFDQLE